MALASRGHFTTLCQESLAHQHSATPANLKAMQISVSMKHYALAFLTKSSLMSLVIDFLLKPVSLHVFSGLLHLVLLVALFVSFTWKKLKVDDGVGSKEKNNWSKWVFCHKKTFFCCLAVSLYNLIMCLVSYFYWRKNGWSDDELVTLLDLLLRTASWGALCVYLYIYFFNSGEKSIPFPLRVWWVFYLSISCYCLVVDIIHDRKHGSSQIEYLVPDGVSVFTGMLLCYIGIVKKGSEGGLLEKPLLSGDSCLNNNLELNQSRGCDDVTPFSNAGLFSMISFSWIGSLIDIGNKRRLDLEDVPQLDTRDSAVCAFPAFRSKLELNGGNVNGITTFKLATALIFSIWKEILYTALYAVLFTLSSYVCPYLVDAFVQCLTGRGQFKNQGYLLASAFFIAKLVEFLSESQWFFRLRQMGIRIRAVLVAEIYEKSLSLSCQSRQGCTTGEIINVMAVDAERIADFVWRLHDPWLIILQFGLAFSVLYKNLGLSCVASFAATTIVMLLNLPLGRLQKKFQDKLMKSKDKRMKETSEILRNMRIFKLQGWEMKFLSKITEIRKIETGWLKNYVYTSAITSFIAWIAPTFVSLATFGACMLMGTPLESGKILSALATFSILREPIYNLPQTVSSTVQAKVSLDRIVSFLRLYDLQSDSVMKLPRGTSDAAIEVVDGNFSWDSSSSEQTLKDINLKIFHGARVAVCGTVGSGKSSLLSSLLGEMSKISGTLKLCGTKAYVAQSPWIQSGKIEENILFGEFMDIEKYERILEACALKKDLEVLPFGDQTIIGERGINLSGGQKQRIQIARALYQDADIYLFDDPFSAVDAHTGSHLFKEVLLGLLSSKTVVYVTHQVEFLSAADLILVMKDGRITQAGKYNDILKSGTDFMELVEAHMEALSALETRQVVLASENGVVCEEGKKGRQNSKANEIAGNKGQLVQEEERGKRGVGFRVYWNYLTTVHGGALVLFILLAQILFEMLQICSNYWMAWATPMSKDVKPYVNKSTLIFVYGALAVGSSLCIFLRASLLATAGYKTATLLFNKMHLCIFRASMSFFDATPSGRILNRASTDQSTIEMDVPNGIGSVAFAIIRLMGVVGVMSQAAWQVFALFIPVFAACLWYQQYYLPSARELERLAGVLKAPIIQHFAETIAGSTTIRSFDQQLRFQETNIKLIDAFSRAKFHIAGAMQWLCFRIGMLCAITYACNLAFLIYFSEAINPVIAGLAVTYGFKLNYLQAGLIWNFCQMESKIVSTERIFQYMSIPSEPPLVIETNRPDDSWPSNGEVHLENLQVRYDLHMPLVLRGITCTFPGGKKTGIVGRTGSGKSTLIQALFRIVEPAAGQVMIDGTNILSIGLHDLRSRLGIIPQDPTMFAGTIRSNLDPLEEYSDGQIWEALDKCQLGDEIRKKGEGLDSTVSENGENWSMGQRQLVCLGRVLLKKSKILVLDEATASVDTATDNLIQQTVRHHFADCTVITIAHRITSVIDSDMVLLLSHGLIEEYDSPARLLENEWSSFAQLVAEYSVRSSTSFGS